MDRWTDPLDVAQLRVPTFPKEVARLQLGVVGDLVVGLDLGTGNTSLLDERHPVWPRRGRGYPFDHRDQNVPAGVPRGDVLEPLLIRPLRMAEHLAKRAQGALAGGSGREVAVSCAHGLVRSRNLVRRTKRFRNLPCREVAPRLPHLERHARFEERHVDELAAASLFSDAQRGERAGGAVEGTDQVADRHANLDRVATRLAG